MTEPTPRRTATVAATAAAAFAVLLAALHVLKPELAPARHLISEYELGAYGPVMRAAFFCLAIGALALAVTLRRDAHGVPGRAGLALLTAVGIALVAAGVFTLGAPHAAAALTVIPGIPIAAALLTWGLWRHPAWATARTRLATVTVVVWAGLASFLLLPGLYSALTSGRATGVIGIPNRAMMLGYAAWIIAIAAHARTSRRSTHA